MKVIKYTLASIAAVLLILLTVGYFFISHKLIPPPNSLKVSEKLDSIPITWLGDESSKIAALLLPIKIEGINRALYMQFDLGSANTIFYQRPLISLERHLSNLKFKTDSTNHLVDFSFNLGKIDVSATKFRMINYGDNIDWGDSTAVNIIGTIGSDLIEKKLTLLDFRSNTCYFGNMISDNSIRDSLIDFSFKYRCVLFPAVVNGRKQELWYDTGTSGFELMTSKSTWKNISKPGAKIISNDANSWGNTLRTYTVETNGIIDFGTAKVKLESVTYVEGSSYLQEILARATGMGGLIGNKIFRHKQVLIDCKNKKFGIFSSDIQQTLK